jgi:cytochrome c oxidase subunit II
VAARAKENAVIELVRTLLGLPEGASTFADSIDWLHFAIFAGSLVVFLAVALAIIGFYLKFRRRQERQVTERWNPPMELELMFIGTPLVVFITWFIVGYRQFIWLKTPPPDTLDIYVVGKQWMWKYTYPDGPAAIDTLTVPRGRPVRLLITSRDVIHSFFVPALRVKQDAVPARYTELWFEATKAGEYPVYCAEYCGLKHSRMTGRLVVLEPADYEAWLTETRRVTLPLRADSAPLPEPGLAARGQRVALEKGCGRCHTVDGTPHLGPTWRGMYRSHVKLVTGGTVVADEAYLTRSMMDPMADLVAGYAPIMPSFQGQLSAGETAALLEYIKSLGGAR